MIEVVFLALAAAVAAVVWRGGRIQNQELAWHPVRIDDRRRER